MKIRKFLALALAMAMTLSMLAACGGNNSGNNAGNAGNSGDSGTTEVRDDLVLQLNGEPATLDGHVDASVITQSLANNIHSTLVTADENNETVGELAESWEWNEDYTELTFKLRDGICFSDGSPITEEDVLFSFERAMEVGSSAYLAYIESVTSPEDGVIVIKLNQSNTVFLSALRLSYFAIYSKTAIENGMDVAKMPNVTSGPYYVAEWNVGSNIVLKANEYYWRGVARIKTVTMPFIGDENTALIALDTGDIDIMQGGGNLSGSSVDYVEESDNSYLLENKIAAYLFLSLNQDVEYFADLNVRKAIEYGIDREAIILAAVDGRGEPASIPATDYTAGYVEGYPATTRDLEKAKEYLAASNYPDGFSFTVQCGQSTWTKAITVVQSNLQELGITVNIQETDTATAVSNIAAGNYEGCIMSWSNATGDVTNFQPMFTYDGPMEFANMKTEGMARMSELMTASTAAEGAEREKILTEFYDIFVEELPYISLYWPTNYWGVTKDLTIDYPMSLRGYNLYSMHWD